MELSSPASLFSGIIVGVLGTAMLIFGKRQQRLLPMLGGVALGVLPMMVASVALLWTLAAVCLGGVCWIERGR
jgi:membrane associated rhomboid family serine protease